MTILADWLGIVLTWFGLILAWSKLASTKTAWLLIAVGDAVLAVYHFATGNPIWAGIDVAMASFAVWLWYHSKDDDDDRGKRVRSWAKAKLPKPVLVEVRKLSPGGAR